MARERIAFPFNFNATHTFTGNNTFSGNVHFIAPGVVTLSGVTNINGNTTVNGAFTFAVDPIFNVGAVFRNGNFQFGTVVANTAIVEFGQFSTTTVDAGATFTFNNIPIFSAGLKLGASSSVLADYEQNIAFIPVPVGFTIVNGTGAVTFTGTFTKIGTFLHYEIIATLTGTATLAATFGVSSFTGIPAVPVNLIAVNHATDAGGTNYGHGLTDTSGGGTHRSPTIAVTHGGGIIIWSADYETAT